MKKLLLAILLLILPSLAFAQGPNGPSPLIGGANPVIGAGSGQCLYNNSGVLGFQACGGAATSITVGTTTIGSGTNTRVLYDNSGVLGEYTNAQLTALINPVTALLSGAIPAFPNNTTTFFRGDGTYAALPGSFAGFANPTATIGLTAVNGSAATAMRSDAAPALASTITAGGPTGSSSIIPVITWNAAGQLTAVTTASISVPTSANPSVTVGLTAKNGTATTFMTSDSAPALDPTAAYAFSGLGATTIKSSTQKINLNTDASIEINPDTTLTTAGSYFIKAKSASTDTGQGVAYILPANGSANMYMAVDLLIKGAPTNKTGRGAAWIDITSNTQTQVDAGTYETLTLGKYINGVGYIKTDKGSGGSVLYPLVIQPDGTQTGFGALAPYSNGGLIDVTKSSTYTTEAAGITIHTGTIAQPELLLGVDNSAGFAYVQAASRTTSFLTIPLALNPNGGAVGIGGKTTLLGAPAAATLQLGAANAASPVAQTLQAQGSRPGTDSNVGGANLTVTSGDGTGTGTRSTLSLKTPVVVASGTGAQTQTTGLVIDGGTAVSTGYTVAGLPTTALVGARAHVTDALNSAACVFFGVVVAGGTTACPVFWNGAAWVGG